MAQMPENSYHPVCHLFQGQRLHYVMLTWDTFERDHVALMQDWLEKTNLKDATCLYLVLGDVDMVLRIWATASEMADFRELLSNCGVQWKRMEILLINQMSTWYQRNIQKKSAVFAGAVGKLFGANLAEANSISPVLITVPDPPSTKKGAQDIQFLIFLERQYTTRSTLFYELAAELGDRQDEDLAETPQSVTSVLLKTFQNVSLYSYCSDQQQGVIVKGQVAAAQFEAMVGALVHVSGGVRHACFRTVTYVCTTPNLRNNSPFRPGRATHEGPERREIAYNLLKSQDCTFPQFDSPPKSTNGTKSLSAAVEPEQTVSEGERNKLREHFISLVVNDAIWPEFFVWNPRWWKNIEYLRLLFRWVVGGEDKNKQLIASLMRHYARLEMELRKVMPGADARDVMAMAAGKKLRAALKRAKIDEPDIIRVEHEWKASDGKPRDPKDGEDDPYKLTLGTIVKKLEGLLAKLPVTEKAALVVDKDVLSATIASRNELMHGEATRLHSSTRNGDTVIYEWEKHLRPFIRFYLRYHTLHSRIAELWRKHGSEQQA